MASHVFFPDARNSIASRFATASSRALEQRSANILSTYHRLCDVPINSKAIKHSTLAEIETDKRKTCNLSAMPSHDAKINPEEAAHSANATAKRAAVSGA